MSLRKVYIHPAPCPKATVDLEKIAAILVQKGIELLHHPEGADYAITFACGFIDDAKLESIEDILELANLKHTGKLGHIVVVGCMPQKYGQSLKEELPEVDTFVGTSCLNAIPDIVGDLEKGQTERLLVKSGIDDLKGIKRIQLTNSPWSRTVMICDGCDNCCTYCSIPQMRGRLRSRRLPEIIAEIDLLVDRGAKEIILSGQDTASYGKDIGSNLEIVLAEIAETYPNCWIRICYANPDNVRFDLAQVINAYPNVCNYLDMPIQHASPRILSAMGRSVDIWRVEDLINELREKVPDIALRTSIIVGFPGETEREFNELLRFLEHMRFDLLGAFAFSPQPGTPAARLPEQVPDEVKEERLIEVIALQQAIGHQKMETHIGRQVDVLVESTKGDHLQARTQYDMPEVDRIVLLEKCDAHPGDFALARLDSVESFYVWRGKLVSRAREG